MKKFCKTLLLLIAISFFCFSCRDPLDREEFIGEYEGTYHGYMTLTYGFHSIDDEISGDETFSITYGEGDYDIIMLIDDQQVNGTVRGRKATFEDYTLSSEEDSLTSFTTYSMSAKLKKDGSLHYASVIYGNVIYEHNLFPVEGMIEGLASKID